MNDVRSWLDRRPTSADKCTINISATAKKNVRKARFPKPQTSSDILEERTRGFRPHGMRGTADHGKGCWPVAEGMELSGLVSCSSTPN
jgi:hypothetical protein